MLSLDDVERDWPFERVDWAERASPICGDSVEPVSRSVFRSLSTHGRPPPASTTEPSVMPAAPGAPVTSCVSVSFVTPSLPGSIS